MKRNFIIILSIIILSFIACEKKNIKSNLSSENENLNTDRNNEKFLKINEN
jgi:hypothetical protein